MDHLSDTLHILNEYEKSGYANLKIVLDRHLRQVAEKKRSSITRTVYNVIRHERLLSAIIQQLSTVKKPERSVRNLLKIGIYLLHISKTGAPYAVINECVKKAPSRARKYINGLLREVSRKKSILTSFSASLPLSDRYSINETIVNELTHITTHPENFLSYFNREPVFHLRFSNLQANHREQLEKSLYNEEALVNYLEAFDSFSVSKPGKKIHSHLKSGQLYLQNIASQFISIVASRFANKAVLDACGAPGTKSIRLSQLRDDLHIVTSDIHPGRIQMIRNYISEISDSAISPIVQDFNQPAVNDNFDLIILDAPCSSIGTLRKNPDLKIKTDHASVRNNSKIQKALLETAIQRFNPRYILYSVCSFTKSETENVVDYGVSKSKSKKNLTFLDLTSLLESYGLPFKKGKYGFYLLPDDYLNPDLFYLSLIRCD